MTPEAKLNALFAAARPPARDFPFEATVAQAVARRRAWATVGALTPWTIAAAAILWGLRPALTPLLQTLEPALQPTGVILTGAALAAGLALWTARRFSEV